MSSPSMSGLIVGRYRIERPLGSGGMGSVYEAVHLDIDKRAAIKILHLQDAQMGVRFLNEARSVNRVRHPGLVDVYDYGTLPTGQPYLVMEYLDGQTLASWIRASRGGGDFSCSKGIVIQIAEALAAVHERGIVHRDLKPDNIMLLPDPNHPHQARVKIVDFGIAKLEQTQRGSTSSLCGTVTGSVLGTPTYMSPEQCRDSSRVNSASDVYSLGVIFYEMVAGMPPFQGANAADLIVQHLTCQPLPLSQGSRALDARVAELIHRMLDKDADWRPTMSQVSRELARLEQERFPPASVPLLASASTELPPTVREPEVPEAEPLPRAAISGKEAGSAGPGRWGLWCGLCLFTGLVFLTLRLVQRPRPGAVEAAQGHAAAAQLEGPEGPLREPPPPGRWVRSAGATSTEVNLNASLEAARRGAARWFSDPQLVQLSVRCVRSDGMQETLRCRAGSTYVFRSPSHSQGGARRCLVEVELTHGGDVSLSLKDSGACQEPISAPPRCSLEHVWSRARERGISADTLASLDYKEQRWSFLTSGRSLLILDDC